MGSGPQIDRRGATMHPAASLEYRVRRVRARIHVEPHPELTDHIYLTVVDGDADLEITLSAAEARCLADAVYDLADGMESETRSDKAADGAA